MGHLNLFRWIVVAIASLYTNLSFGVVGGTPVEPEMHKSIVNLLFENGMCSGVVVSENAVLAAAHCRDMFGEPKMAVWMEPGVKAPPCNISNIIDHSYEPSAEPILPLNVHNPDIILFKLEKPLCGAKPAILQDKKLKAGDRIFQAGHGSGSGEFRRSFQLELKIIEPEDPAAFVTPLRSLSRRLLERGSDTYIFALPVVPQSSACHNDSGGPSFIKEDGKMLLFGVNGAVLPNAELGAPRCNDFYLHLLSPVEPYLEWIHSTIEEWKTN